jgi:glutathione S-transferase
VRDWQAVLAFKSDGPFFFGDEASVTDSIVFGALATTVLTPIETPIRDFLRAQPDCLAYAERMMARFYPEFPKAYSDWEDSSFNHSPPPSSGEE